MTLGGEGLRQIAMNCRTLVLFPLLLLVLLNGGCGSRSIAEVDEDAEAAGLWRDLEAAPDAQGMRDLVSSEVVQFAFTEQQLLDQRSRFANAVLIARANTADGQPLSGADIERLNRTFADMLGTVQTVMAVAARHAEWRHVDACTCANGTRVVPPESLRLTGIALSAAASLALYDTYLLNCQLVIGNEPIRRALNQGDAANNLPGDQVDAIMRRYLSYGSRTRVHRCLRDLTRAGAAWTNLDEVHAAFLRERISASNSGRLLSATRRIPLDQAVPASWTLLSSDLRELGDNVVGSTSQGFGNVVGLVSVRRGKLYGNPAIEADLRTRLQPGDILVEKTPFRLTDKFIPGHWGHVAIWIGNETELRHLGLWDDPLVQRHAAAISRGEGVVEALRNGVQLSPLAHFLDIDDLGILRQPSLSDDERRAIIRRSLRQIGKAYDFNFDVETADRIVCSELVYQVYNTLRWPTDRTAGRWTISPDQVAKCCLPMGPLSLVELWCDGKPVSMDPVAAMTALLELPTPTK